MFVYAVGFGSPFHAVADAGIRAWEDLNNTRRDISRPSSSRRMLISPSVLAYLLQNAGNSSTAPTEAKTAAAKKSEAQSHRYFTLFVLCQWKRRKERGTT
jgi:hypothetical protein